jgi:CRP-like cAMP-binding protein
MEFAEFVASNGRTVEVEPGRHVFRQGGDDRSLYLLQSGLLKAYYLSDEGRETIKSFILPGETIASLVSAYRHECCSFNLLALEHSVLRAVGFDALRAAVRTDLPFASAVVDLLLEFGMKKERREKELLTESAEARYRLLLEASPGLPGKVKQKDLARYLGITPVALSRIRARLDLTPAGRPS